MFKYNGFGNTLEIAGLGANLSDFNTIENLNYNDDLVAFDLTRPLSGLASNDFQMYSFMEKMARQLYNKNGVFANSLQTAFSFNTTDNIRTLNFGSLGYKTFVRASPGIAGFGYTQSASQEGFLVVNKPNIEEAERQLCALFSLKPEDDLEYVKIKYNYTTGRYKMRVVKCNSAGEQIVYDFLNKTAYPTANFDDDTIECGYKMFVELFVELYTDTVTTPLKSDLLSDFFYKTNPAGLSTIVCEPTFYIAGSGNYYMRLNQYGMVDVSIDIPTENEFALHYFIITSPNTSTPSYVYNLSTDDKRIFYTDKEIYTRKIDFNTVGEVGDQNWIFSDTSATNTYLRHRIGSSVGDKIIFEYWNGTIATPILDLAGDLSATFYGTLNAKGPVIFGDLVTSDTITLNSTIISDLTFNDENRYIKLGGQNGSATTRTLFLQNDGAGLANFTTDGDITISNGNLITENITSTLFNTIATTLSIGGAATTLNIGNTTTQTQTINVSAGITTNNQTFNIGANITSGAQTINIGTSKTATGVQTINIGAAANALSTVYVKNTTVSTSTTTGALVIGGGVGIGEKLYVNSIIYSISGYIRVASDSTNSFLFDTTTANVNIGNVASAINIGNISTSSQTINIGTAVDTTTAQTITIGKATNTVSKTLIAPTTASTSTTTGALVIGGGVGIGEKLYVTGNIQTNSGYFNSGTTTGNLFNQSGVSSTVNVANYSNEINIGNLITTSQIINIGTAVDTTTAQTITIGKATNTVSKVLIAPITASTSTTTGALVIGGGIGIGEKIYVASDIQSNSGYFNTSNATGNLFPTNATTVNIADVGQTINIGKTTAANQTITFGGALTTQNQIFSFGTSLNTGNQAFNIGTNITSGIQTFNIGTNAGMVAAQMINIGQTGNTLSSVKILNATASTTTSTGALIVTGGVGIGGRLNVAGIVGITGNVTLTGDLAVNGGDITTTSATATLFNINATTLSIGGDATTLNIGKATGIQAINVGTADDTASTQVITLGRTGNSLSGSFVTIPLSQDASSYTTGALRVAGGVGIGGKLYVAGNIVAVNGVIWSGTTTGSLFANSGVTSAVNIANYSSIIAIGNTTTAAQTINIGNNADTAATQVITIGRTNNALAGSYVSIPLSQDSSSSTTGALRVAGGVGIGGALFTAGSFNVGSGKLTVSSTTGDLSTIGDVYIGGGDLKTTVTTGTFNIFPDTLTGTLNIGGVAGTLLLSRSATVIDIGTTHTTAQVISLGKASIVGSYVKVLDTDDATSSTTGSLRTSGGLSAEKAMYAGSSITSGTGLFASGTTTGSLFDQSSVTGTVSIATYATTGNLLNRATSIYLGDTNTANQTINIGSGITTNTQTINVGVNITGAQTINFGNSASTTSSFNIKTSTVSSSYTTGALIITGGVGIGGTLYSHGAIYTDAGVIRSSSAATASYLFDTTTSSVSLGAAATSVYIGNTTTAAQNIYIGNSADILSDQTIVIGRISNARAGSYVSIPLTGAASGINSGALRVAGGVGIGGALFTGGNLNINSNFIVTASNGNTVTSGTLAVNGGAISSTDTTFDLLSSTAGQVINTGYADITSYFKINSIKGATDYQTAGLVVGGGIGAGDKIIANSDIISNSGTFASGSATTGTLFNAIATTVNIGTIASTMNFGINPGSAQIINIGTTNSTYTQTINVGTGLTSVAQIINIGKNGNVASSVNILNSTVSSNATTGALVVTGGVGISGALNVTGATGLTGNLTITGDLAINGGDLTSSSSTFNLLNTPTTINIGVAGTTIGIGASTGVTTFNSTTDVDATPSTASVIMNGGLWIKKQLYVATAARFATTLAVTGNTTLTGDLAVNGGDITTTSGTATVFNTTATTLSIGGAATTLNLGGVAGAGTINIGTAADTTTNQIIYLGRTNNAVSSVKILNTTASTTTSTGALVISGGVGIGGNTYIGGLLNVTGTSTLTGDVTVTGDLAINGGDLTTTDSTFNLLTNTAGQVITMGYPDANSYVNIQATKVSSSGSTGALVVAGGVGIGGALNVSGIISGGAGVNVAGTLAVNGAYLISDDATFFLLDNSSVSTAINFGRYAESIVMGKSSATGSVTIQGTTASSAYNNGALIVKGGVGINGALNIAGAISSASTITSGSTFNANGQYINTDDTIFYLLNTTATTMNFAGAATTINIGAATSSVNLANDLNVLGDEVKIASKYEFKYDNVTNSLDLVYIG